MALEKKVLEKLAEILENSKYTVVLTGYYEGSKLILITLYPHYSDKLADMVINQRVDDTLEELITYMKKKRND